jgi:Right handed beta helix region
MSRNLTWLFPAVVVLAVSVPLQALNYEVGGCKTGTSYVNFSTISAAVVGVPAGAKIQVCPGVYPEQVTITQPLTLEGITFNNASRAVITANPSGAFSPNVSGLFGNFYAQVLVQNVSPPGPVDIVGITVDGVGITFDCSGSEFLAGIFYASGTSGTVNEVTGRNNQSNGCGYSIWVENGAATKQSITVENNSIHEGGIVALAGQNPPTLTATVKGNFVASTNQTYNLNSFQGIAVSGANGSVTGNVVTGGNYGIDVGNDNFFIGGGTVNVSQNTVADMPSGFAMYLNGSNGTITSNKMSNVGDAFIFTYSSNPATIESNTAMNTQRAVQFASCTTDWTIKKNVFSDSQVAFWGMPSPIPGNSLYNIDTLVTGSCI